MGIMHHLQSYQWFRYWDRLFPGLSHTPFSLLSSRGSITDTGGRRGCIRILLQMRILPQAQSICRSCPGSRGTDFGRPVPDRSGIGSEASHWSPSYKPKFCLQIQWDGQEYSTTTTLSLCLSESSGRLGSGFQWEQCWKELLWLLRCQKHS